MVRKCRSVVRAPRRWASAGSFHTAGRARISSAWPLPLPRLLAQLRIAELRVYADTIGIAVPGQVKGGLRAAAAHGRPYGVHLHDTRNTAVANALSALEAGATLFESSVGGAGGCPFAPGATGNLATEDLAWVLEREGIPTGVDVDAVVDVAHWLEEQLERPLPGALSRPGCSLTGV